MFKLFVYFLSSNLRISQDLLSFSRSPACSVMSAACCGGHFAVTVCVPALLFWCLSAFIFARSAEDLSISWSLRINVSVFSPIFFFPLYSYSLHYFLLLALDLLYDFFSSSRIKSTRIALPLTPSCKFALSCSCACKCRIFDLICSFYVKNLHVLSYYCSSFS